MAYDKYSLMTVPVGNFADNLRYFTHEAKVDMTRPKNEKGRYPQKELNGKPLWVITATVEGRFMKVTVPLVDEPVVESLIAIEFKGLVCGAYNGSLWFRADDVDLV